MFPVILPTETINRELDYQLILGAHLTRRGAKVFIGHRDAVHLACRYLRHGLFVGKAIEPFFPHADLGTYEGVKRSNFVVVHLDEEGAIFPGNVEDWRITLARRLDVKRIAHNDVVCVWGRFQGEFYRSQGATQEIRVTGHPRFDLYRAAHRSYFAEPARKLQQRFGDFVLLNTNLSSANNGLGLKYTFTKRFLYDPASPIARWEALRFWLHTSKILLSFVELIHRLSDEFPGMQIVIRPHPSESHDYYQTVTSGLPNVHVLHEGSVAPWLFAAKALIHDGCTTGLEAWLGDVPVINYKALADDRYDLLLPNHYGTRCTTPDEVIGVLHDVVRGHAPAPPRKPNAQDAELMINLEQDSLPLLLDAIELARRRLGPASYWRSPHLVHAQLAAGVERLANRARQLSPQRRQISQYAHQKFYGLKQADMADRLRRVGEVTGIRPRWRLYGDSMVTLEPT